MLSHQPNARKGEHSPVPYQLPGESYWLSHVRRAHNSSPAGAAARVFPEEDTVFFTDIMLQCEPLIAAESWGWTTGKKVSKQVRRMAGSQRPPSPRRSPQTLCHLSSSLLQIAA